jgi:hypothetical protein
MAPAIDPISKQCVKRKDNLVSNSNNYLAMHVAGNENISPEYFASK